MASATDLLVGVGDPGSATTLDSPGYSIGGTSINVVSTSNWPSTGEAVIFAIDESETVNGVERQVAGTYNEFEGTVASATQITNVDWKRGSGDRNYSAGTTTRVYIPVSAERENRIKEWGEVEHSAADGTHSSTLITSRTADTSPASGDSVLTSDTSDSDNLKKVTLANLGSNGAWVNTGGVVDDAVTDAKRPRLKHAKVTGTDTVTNSSNFAIEFTSAVVDPEGWTDIGGTNPERVTVGEAGLYLLEGSVEFGANSTSDRRQTAIFVNGAEIHDSHGRSQARPSTGEPSFVSTQAVVVLAANDYVTLIAQQDSGGNLACVGALTVTKLSD